MPCTMKLSDGPIATHRGDFNWPGAGHKPAPHFNPRFRVIPFVHLEGRESAKGIGFWQCLQTPANETGEEVRLVVPYCPRNRAGTSTDLSISSSCVGQAWRYLRD